MVDIQLNIALVIALACVLHYIM